MSMNIIIDDDYCQKTYYSGEVELPKKKTYSKYRFTVSVIYFSNLNCKRYYVDKITWEIEPTEEKQKAEERIEKLIMSWYYNDNTKGDVENEE